MPLAAVGVTVRGCMEATFRARCGISSSRPLRFLNDSLNSKRAKLAYEPRLV